MDKPDILKTESFAPLARLLEKWTRLSENISNEPKRMPILLPDVFLRAHYGVSTDVILDILTDHLYEKQNLMGFYGDVPCFEFYLNQCQPGGPFREINRMVSEVRRAAGFRNHFEGIVHIDVSEWIYSYTDKHFREFLYYLSENSDNWLIVLSVSYSQKKKEQVDAMEAFISMFLRLESLEIKQPWTDYYKDVILKGLSDYGLRPDDDALALLGASVDKLRGNHQFDSERTLSVFIRDIIYTLYSGQTPPPTTLTADLLTDFGPDSDYVRRALSVKKQRKLGFVDEEETK